MGTDYSEREASSGIRELTEAANWSLLYILFLHPFLWLLIFLFWYKGLNLGFRTC